MALQFVLLAVGFIPNIYYGATRGNWGLGWDYVITGHDYTGDLIDYIIPPDSETVPDTGLTTGDLEFLNQQASAVTEMAMVAIVAIVAFALIFFLTGRKNKSTKRRR